jgi:TonB family protein
MPGRLVATPSASGSSTGPASAGPGDGQAATEAVTGGALIKSPLPRYPRRARARGLEGEVTVRYDVNERGRVAGIEVLSARPDRLFETSVRRAVRKWRHEPFVLEGRPVTASVTRTFEFGIRGEPVEGSARDDDRCRRVTGSRLCRSRDGYEELGVVVVHNPL